MSESSAHSTQVVVVGGGPGGYPAAFRARSLGYDVTIVDLEKNPGGVCLYRGCIPSKAFLHLARVISEARESEAMGLSFTEPKIDLDRMRSWKQSVVDRLTGGLGQLAKARKVKTIQGRARFTGPNALSIEHPDGSTSSLAFEHAILATGSRPASIPGLPDSPRVLDSTSALDLEDVPKRLLVVGGGYIGLELGTVYASLGSSVDVVEMLPNLLPGADQDLVAILEKRLRKEFGNFYMETRLESVAEHKNGLSVTLQPKEGDAVKKKYDKILISIGRTPNTQDLGLEHTAAEVDGKGFIVTDAQRRTGEPSIFAIGDIAGEPMLAHKATHEGVVAAEAIHGLKTAFDPAAIPAVVFTDPEIAWTGLTEREAREQGFDIKVAKFPWAASGRAITLERTDGLTKLIVEKESQRILGVGMAGVNAGDMIAEGTLGIEMGANVDDLALTIHPHPTLSETVMEAAEVFHGHSAHYA